jgi:hypothetical protein
VMGRKLFRLRSLVAVAAVAAIAVPAGHAASGIGKPASPGRALTPAQCAAMPPAWRTHAGACLPGEPGIGVSAVETAATQARPGRPLPTVAQRTVPTNPAPPVGDSFNWLDAGIGGSVGIAALLLTLAGAGVVRSRRLAHS